MWCGKLSGWLHSGKTVVQLEILATGLFFMCLAGSVDLGFIFLIHFYAGFQIKVRSKIKVYWLWLTHVIFWLLLSILNDRTNSKYEVPLSRRSQLFYVSVGSSKASHTNLAKKFRSDEKWIGPSSWSCYCRLPSGAVGKNLGCFIIDSSFLSD